MADKTRAERIESIRQRVAVWFDQLCYARQAEWSKFFAIDRLKLRDRAVVLANQAINEVLALPPDPPRGDGWDALRELRAWVEREIDPADRQQSVLDEIDRLLAAAPKPDRVTDPIEPMEMTDDDLDRAAHELDRSMRRVPRAPKPEPTKSPAEPAQDDEVSDELQLAIDGFGEAAYDWADSNTDPESELGERERQKERELKAVIAREKADLRAALIECGEIVGASVSEKCSSAFLCEVAGEVRAQVEMMSAANADQRAKLAAAEAELRTTREQAIESVQHWSDMNVEANRKLTAAEARIAEILTVDLRKEDELGREVRDG